MTDFHGRPLAPEALNAQLTGKLSRCMDNSPHPYETSPQYPDLLTWLVFELEWALGQMRQTQQSEHLLLRAKGRAATELLQEMLEAIKDNWYMRAEPRPIPEAPAAYCDICLKPMADQRGPGELPHVCEI